MGPLVYHLVIKMRLECAIDYQFCGLNCEESIESQRHDGSVSEQGFVRDVCGFRHHEAP